MYDQNVEKNEREIDTIYLYKTNSLTKLYGRKEEITEVNIHLKRGINHLLGQKVVCRNNWCIDDCKFSVDFYHWES